MTNKQALITHPFTLTWLLLVVATGIGWWFGQTAQSTQGNVSLAVSGVIIMAFVKIWLVGFQFMELKHANSFWKAIFKIYACLIGGILMILL